MRPRLLDLFSGIGGFSLGLERAGFDTVAFCEISAPCRHLLNHHWPKVPCYDDIKTLTAERLAADGIAVDAICGGFPCQDLSYAGKGAGLAGERSGLWSEYVRLIRELRPSVVFVENVAALLGRGPGRVLGDLAALGYDAWWDCIPAAAVGAPHRRDRLWLIAYARGQQHEGYGDALRREVASGLSRAIAGSDAPDERQPEARGLRCGEPQERPASVREDVADAEHNRISKRRRIEITCEGGRQSGGISSDVAACDQQQTRSCVVNTDRQRQQELNLSALAARADIIDRRPYADRREWLSEPDVGRVAHGVPARVDRLHGLGNAVVPQIPEILGRAVLAALA